MILDGVPNSTTNYLSPQVISQYIVPNTTKDPSKININGNAIKNIITIIPSLDVVLETNEQQTLLHV